MATRELSSPPDLRVLYGKAAAGSTVKPVLKRVPVLGGRFGGGKPVLPDTELLLRGARIDLDHLAAYDRVCGFTLRDELPPTYPHMLAFPLQMQLMTDSSFPFPVIGMVHLRNEIEQLRPIRDSEKLDVRVRAGDLGPHPKGRQFVLHSEATVDGEPVWVSRSTYLRKGGGSGSSGKPGSDEKPAEPEDPNAVWDVPDDIGRRYARVSGDSNPIHLRRSTALAMGMSRPIAHGMWTKARCLAALEGELPGAFAVDASFKLPVQLPARVAFRTWPQGSGRGFSLRDHRSGKPHVVGSVDER